MRLIIYSGGDHDQNKTLDAELVRQIGRTGRITYIPASAQGGTKYFPTWKDDKRRAGLRHFYQFAIDAPFSPKQCNEAFRSEAIFLSGGNTFYFLKQLRKQHMLPVIRAYLRSGGLLIGVSAGSIMMTPDITTAGLVPWESDKNEVGLKDLKALHLVNFEVYPHYRSEPHCDAILKRYSERKKRTLYALPDSSGIVRTDGILSFHGAVTCFQGGKAERMR
jgi:dipeptidase E